MNRKEPVQVVIADDHPMLRRGLLSVLGPERGIEVVGEVGSFTELIGSLAQVTPDVVLLDLGGMGTQPITAVSVLKRTYPHLTIIIYSSTLSCVRELLRTGAQGYIAKEDWEDDVVTAIHAVMRGQVFLSPTVNDYLERSGGTRKEHKITPKEWEVLKLIADGLGTQEIMAHLMIAEQTVNNYVHNLFRKTGCTERTQLAEWYRRWAESQVSATEDKT
jgi:DNA-binding NarL/FixJ family response regulator